MNLEVILCCWLQVAMKTEVTWVRDMLHGDDAYGLRLKLLKQVPEEYSYKDDEWICLMEASTLKSISRFPFVF